jgi:serine/threonine protein phosphatase PrpC
VLLFIQSTLFSSPLAFAAHRDTPQQPENLLRAGVSVVRIVANYGLQTPTFTPPPLPTSSTKSNNTTTSPLDTPSQTCTGLGVVVASKASATQQNAWVLTDGSLINKNDFTCKSLGAASIVSNKLRLNSINVYLSSSYNSTLSMPMTGNVNSVQCSDANKCSDGAAIFAFHSNTLLPYAQLPTSSTAPPEDFATIELSQSTQVTATPTTATNLQQFLTPTSTTIQKSDGPNVFDGFENGTPIVDQQGYLTKLYLKDAEQPKIFKATDANAFLLKQQITSDPAPNDVSSNWNGGITAYYQGANHYDTAKSLFTKANVAADNQFQGASNLITTINTAQNAQNKNGNSSSASDGNSSPNGITFPLIGTISYLLLAIVIIGLIVFVLLLVLLNQLFKRGQRNREFAEADKQATLQAQQIQEREAQQATAHAAVRTPLPQVASQPVQPQVQHDPVASRSSGIPAPANASYADYPTIDMNEAKRNSMPDIEKTQQFSPVLEQTVKMGRPLGFEVITSTDPGIKRKYKPNEDSLFAVKGVRSLNGQMQQIGLFVVADGMGGHANGQDASRLAIQTIIDYMLPRLVHVEETSETPEKLLVDSVQQANQAVHEHNVKNGADMGTTVTATLIIDTTAHIANVGDSRTYLYRTSNGLSKVTRDHSVVASLVDAGIIKPDDIYTHPKRNQIYRSLGEKPFVEVDPFDVQLQAGDKMLLCSDGLWDMVRDPEIQHVLEVPITDPQQLGDNLIKAAHAGGGEDNISVIVVNVVERSDKSLTPGLDVIYRQENVTMPQI